MLSAYSDELTLEEQDPGMLTHNDDLLNGDISGGEGDGGGGSRARRLNALAHTIHLSLRDTTFKQETVDTSVIENYGGRVQSTSCAFVDNTAESVIRSERGTVAMTSTDFISNDLRGDAGVVVLDSGSALERNDGNCGGYDEEAANSLESIGDSQSEGGANTTAEAPDGAISPSTGELGSSQNQRCEGINAGGICDAFESCVNVASDSDGEVQQSGCYGKWEDLVAAVRDRPDGARDFIICPGTKFSLSDTSPPVLIDGAYISIQCGSDDSPSKDCVISGGPSHFRVVGSPQGVQLARLSMWGATGSSVMALGDGGSLSLRDCEWGQNEGASVILVHSDESLDASTLSDLALFESSSDGGMIVEITDCTFVDSVVKFGTIVNLGGTLSVHTSRFARNSGMGGDIVVRSDGSLSLDGSCFDASSSTAPGTIFIESGSEISSNENNFGFGNTAGGYGDDGTCIQIFQEAEGVACLGEDTASCNGSCLEFALAACPLETGSPGLAGSTGDPATPSAAPPGKDQIIVPAYNKKDDSGSSKTVPIAVATIVGAFIVFGLVGIVLRRRKISNNVSTTEQPRGGIFFSLCSKCRRRKDKYDEGIDDAGGDNTNMDEDVA